MAEMDVDAPDEGAGGPAVYTCPMHPAVVGHEHGGAPGDAHGHEAAGGIESEDDMVEINRLTTAANRAQNTGSSGGGSFDSRE